MTQEEITIYRDALKTHLCKSVARGEDNEDLRIWWIEFMENALLDFIRQKGIAVESIYAWTDKSVVSSLQRETKDYMYQALRIYEAFLGSKWHPINVASKKALGKGEKKQTQKTNGTDTSSATAPTKPIIKLVEGAKLQERDREIHQRNPKLRQLCIEAFGSEYNCVVCGMNFVERYGEIGKEFIEVHHLNPISETEGEHEVDPATEMVPLCSNCHSMIHRLEDPGDWKKLKEMFETTNE